MISDQPLFIPGTHYQLAWDSTALGWLKECPRKYQLMMLQHWFPKEESVHLFFGIMMHEAHEVYDKARTEGFDHNASVRLGVKFIMLKSWGWEGSTTKNRHTAVRTFVWYYCKYVEENIAKKDPAETYILQNGKPAIELHFQFDTHLPAPNGTNYVLTGHMDKIVVFQDNIYVSDKKSTQSALSSHYFSQYNPDNQMTLYTIAGKVVFSTPVRGVLIDAFQVTVGYSDFMRDITFRTDDQIAEWVHDTSELLKLAEYYVQRDYWPMNDKSCHKYGGCPFRDVCKAPPQFRENILRTKYIQREWNPLIARE